MDLQPLRLSLLEVTRVRDNVIQVKGLDMLDRAPILDIKPEICTEQERR